MNPSDPEIKNVTPLEPIAPAPPVAAATPPVQIATPRAGAPAPVAAKPPQSMRTLVIGVVVLLAIVLIGYKLFHHHRSSYEATADAVTVAIGNNNMTPVLHKFNAERLPELENRVQVARLANLVAPLGKFEGSKEITPPNAEAGYHEFTETFANGTLDEKYALDADGKIVHFHIGQSSSSTTAP